MAQGLYIMASGKALPIRAEGESQNVSRPHVRVLEDMADLAHLRRGPPCRLHGRHLALQKMRDTHRLHG